MRRMIIFFAAAAVMAAAGQSVRADEGGVKLSPVVVTATKTEKDPKDVTQSVTVITADEIKRSGATTTDEVVRRASSVLVEEYGPRGSASNVGIRGSSTSQVLVLLDGLRLNSPRTGGYDLSELPVNLDEIERIEIVRGPSSALYGADALGGVVNIITKKREATGTRFTGKFGNRGYDSLSLGQSGRHDALYYRMSAGRETADGYRVNSDLDQKNAGALLAYDLTDNASLSIKADYLGKESGVPGSTKYPSPNARQQTRNTVTGMGYKNRFSSAVDLSLDAYYNRDVLLYKNPDSFPADDTRHASATLGAEIRSNWLVTSWNAVTVGAEAKGDSMESTEAGDHASRIAAVYIQDEVSVGESLILVAGARKDDHSIYGDRFSPRVSARYRVFSTGTIVRVSGGKAFRAPTFYDLYWPFSSITYFGTTYITEGNPTIQPETSKEYEAGIEQELGRTASLRLTGFSRKVKNLIDWTESQPNATTFRYTPENVGRAHIRGVEAEANFVIGKLLTWTANYTYMNPLDEITGEKIYSIPEGQLKSTCTVALASKTFMYLEGRSVRRYMEKPDDPWKYSVFDGRLSQSVTIGESMQADLFVGMNNIFDRTYEVRKGYPMPPRELYAGISAQF